MFISSQMLPSIQSISNTGAPGCLLTMAPFYIPVAMGDVYHEIRTLDYAAPVENKGKELDHGSNQLILMESSRSFSELEEIWI